MSLSYNLKQILWLMIMKYIYAKWYVGLIQCYFSINYK